MVPPQRSDLKATDLGKAEVRLPAGSDVVQALRSEPDPVGDATQPALLLGTKHP